MEYENKRRSELPTYRSFGIVSLRTTGQFHSTDQGRAMGNVIDEGGERVVV